MVLLHCRLQCNSTIQGRHRTALQAVFSQRVHLIVVHVGRKRSIVPFRDVTEWYYCIVAYNAIVPLSYFFHSKAHSQYDSKSESLCGTMVADYKFQDLDFKYVHGRHRTVPTGHARPTLSDSVEYAVIRIVFPK